MAVPGRGTDDAHPRIGRPHLNAYLAFRAALLACSKVPAIQSLVCCGLATGIGGMEPMRCAIQMKVALTHVRGPARIASFQQIHAVHAALRTAQAR
jgi:hypothetical protein